ncbi:MAG: bifunctional phosphopantothenoylcysteine decarboxylase/phosphopantothenate--cysteine ligase CoaBC [Acidobacteriota bacterium]|nr:bifunctional phosphopantothenoylcysteine decarboxylase/phosphopantothenate--cysteine ligase CoaBC [Acidobacteriota bacterium]
MALVALGVGGGIGAYKAVEVARGLQKHGHDVVAVLTRNARRFITPLTFEAITRRRVLTSQYEPGANADIEHIAVANDIGLLLVAPATANILAKFAHGIADDYLSTLYISTPAPVLLAPAMNTRMLEHPATQENARVLAARGVRFVDPGAGYLACGWIGKGRLAEPAEIVAAAEEMLSGAARVGPLAGRRVVITAGPTFEDIDPVRFIGNRSSGRMGYAIAAEAARRGALVSLISGPVTLAAPAGTQVTLVRSAADMHAAVMRDADGADAVVMAAAVADYAPAGGALDAKMEKGHEGWSLSMSRTRDILADLGAARTGARPVLVGFAAQTGDPVPHARRKLAAKRVDLIVANDVARPGSGFDVDTNEVTLIDERGAEPLPLLSKDAVAAAVLDRVERILDGSAKIVSA